MNAHCGEQFNKNGRIKKKKKKEYVKSETPKTLRKRFYYFFFDSFNRWQDTFLKLKHLYCGFLQFCLDWIEKLYITFCTVEISAISICNTKSLFYKYKHINIQYIFMRYILFQTWELGKKCKGNFILTFAVAKVRYNGITTVKVFVIHFLFQVVYELCNVAS